MKRWVGNSAALLAATVMIASASGAALAQDKGYYTEDQAAHGQSLFDANCAQCHGQNLEGVEAPGLAGPDVMGNWATAQGMYDYFSVAMPPTAPGKLGADNYVDIMSYILKVNGAPAGDKALTKDDLPNVDLVAATSQGAVPAQPAAGAPAQPAAAPAAGAPDTKVPQSFTWGKQLPTVGAADKGQAAPAQPAAPKVPQSFTFGKDLPTVSK